MEKKDPTILEDFFSFSSSSFSSITRAFPWPIKGKAGHPMKGTRTHRNKSPQLGLKPIEPRTDQNTQAHSRETIESWHPFAPLIRDLGHVPLSTVYNPYYELSVLATRAAATNWT